MRHRARNVVFLLILPVCIDARRLGEPSQVLNSATANDRLYVHLFDDGTEVLQVGPQPLSQENRVSQYNVERNDESHGKKETYNVEESRTKNGQRRIEEEGKSYGIMTTMLGGNSYYGCFFDVRAKKPLTVETLKVHIKAKMQVQIWVYTKAESMVKDTLDPSTWELVVDPVFITAQGEGQPSTIPPQFFRNVFIKGGETQAFYVAISASKLMYSNGELTQETSDVFVSDDNMEILIGAGAPAMPLFDQGYVPKNARLILNRVWNGWVKYKLGKHESDLSMPKKTVPPRPATQSQQPTSANGVALIQNGSTAAKNGYVIANGASNGALVSQIGGVATNQGYAAGYGAYGGATVPQRVVPAQHGFGHGVMVPQSGNVATNQGYIIVHGASNEASNGATPLPSKQIVHRSNPDALSGENLKPIGPLRHINAPIKGSLASHGIMFDVISTKDIVVESFSVPIFKTTQVQLEVWARRGTHMGFERGNNSWKRLCTTQVQGRGRYTLTDIPSEHCEKVSIPAGKRTAFYINFFEAALMYDRGEKRGDVYVANSSIKILTGTVIGGFQFEGALFHPRAFHGTIRYSNAIKSDEELPQPGPSQELIAGFGGETGSYGLMWDFIALRDVMLQRLEIHALVGDINVDVFCMDGTHEGSENIPDNWTKILSTSVVGRGMLMRTKLPDFQFPFLLKAGQREALYVSLSSPLLRYSNGTEIGETFVSDQFLQIMSGSGIGSKEFGKPFPSRSPNVVMVYAEPQYSLMDLGWTSLGASEEIRTPLDENAGSYGIFFEILTHKPLYLTGMSVVSKDADDEIQVFMKDGTYKNDHEKPFKWLEICKTAIVGRGEGQLTTIPFDNCDPFYIEGGKRMSMYVTTTGANIRYSKTDENMVGEVLVQTDAMSIFVGSGCGSYPFGAVFDGRKFNGVLEVALAGG